MGETRNIEVGETVDGDPVELPVVELLTGRGFVTGKSGSGKSNTASVVCEELLDAGFPMLIIDCEGEYYGLKEEYELLHVGADEECDIQVSPEHAEKVAELALEENIPVILDVSGYLDDDVSDELILKTARHLFAKEKKLKKPFLLVCEEVHEYIPEGGGMDETGKMLIKIGKRGRKHGLGIVGISQRPADVKKDFITQANWLVWHRLTWENDTNVVGRIIGSEYAEKVTDLDDGQAFMQTDWAEADLRTVQFRRKRTFDAGATPGLDDFERPELKSVSDNLVGDLQSITEDKEEHENRIAELEAEIEKKETRIETLEDELEDARDISQAANKMADAIAGNTGISAPTAEDQQTLDEVDGDKSDREKSNAEIEHERNEFRKRARELEERLDDLASTKTDLEDRVESLVVEKETLAEERDELRGERDELATRVDELEAEVESMRAELGDERDKAEQLEAETDDGEVISDQADRIAFLEMALEQLQRRLSEDDDAAGSLESVSTIDLLHEPPVEEKVEAAIRESNCRREHAWDVIAVLADRGPMRTRDLEPLVDATGHHISSAIIELRKVNVLERDQQGRHEINRRYVEGLIETKAEREGLAPLKNRSRR
ncbi:DUF87 domain-containing protein [Halorubellus sp. JP-L1]|uniref:helicase HerA domain-containing protein n=1 Tax=Halorubellus sp. JP-L1 TaxID=2715753 RepID=UPI00140A4E24|nr:DUF87 domain-containing protein [Halorubellus sp. JP-L1]NHN43269.1 DUF87 domain-containing protein [Halorubellus sp. JP-L1]